MMQAVNSCPEVYDREGNLVAIIVTHDFNNSGVNFLGKPSFPLQLGVSLYKRDGVIQPHLHLQKEVIVKTFQEIVHIDSGRTLVDLYDSAGRTLKTVELRGGDTIFFVGGGHGFRMVEDTKIIEVKQGPYVDKQKDKQMIK